MTRITAILPEGVATHYIEANGPVRKRLAMARQLARNLLHRP
jgi:hypothetical protein